jgi:hypothetical protein
MPRYEPGLLVMCFYMAGGIGFEPMHVGIKIRCLNQLGEPPTERKIGSPTILLGGLTGLSRTVKFMQPL